MNVSKALQNIARATEMVGQRDIAAALMLEVQRVRALERLIDDLTEDAFDDIEEAQREALTAVKH